MEIDIILLTLTLLSNYALYIFICYRLHLLDRHLDGIHSRLGDLQNLLVAIPTAHLAHALNRLDPPSPAAQPTPTPPPAYYPPR